MLTSLFFAPDWPLRFVRWLAARSAVVDRWRTGWRGRLGKPVSPDVLPYPRPAALVLLVAIHVFLPLRNWAFGSDVNWTEEGHRYSWRMMLRSKQGRGVYRVVDEAGNVRIVNPRDSLDVRQYGKLVTHPDMILQYAHHLRDVADRPVRVYGDFQVRLNGRQRQEFIDPTVDLATLEWRWLGVKPWIREEVRE